MITLRDYQAGSIEATFDYWRTKGGNPLIELATGLGKSIVVAEIAKRILERFPTMRIVMLVHVRELVRQNYEELLNIWPQAPVGIYSAGLNARDRHHRIIYASIQSVYKKPEVFAPRDLILIDEAHLVPAKSEGMYRQFLDGLRDHSDLRVAGLTATPYRLDSGSLLGGDDPLFDEIVYKYGVGEGTEDGWLAPLTAKLGEVEMNVKGVAKRGGEFVGSALNEAALDQGVIAAACEDLIARGHDRGSWLAFCAGVDHAGAVRDALRERGISAECVTGKTPKGERDAIIEAFKRREVRCLTNANVLTTGFNAPNVDLIAMLRPTLSTGLYVQMLGRGTRALKSVNLQACADAQERRAAIAASDKPNCLVLDYAGNVRRHGPVDAIDVDPKDPKESDGDSEGKVDVDEVRAKECPGCGHLIALNARRCQYCGEEFGEPKHEIVPDGEVAVLTRELDELWLPVTFWNAQVWYRGGDFSAVPTLRVDITAGVQSYAEWIPFEHSGFGRQKALAWWERHGGDDPIPRTVADALERFNELTMPREVTLKKEGKYMRVNKRRFNEIVQQPEEVDQ